MRGSHGVCDCDILRRANVKADLYLLRGGFVRTLRTPPGYGHVAACRLRCGGCYFSLAVCRLRCGGCYFSLAACRLRCGGCYFSLAVCRLRCGGCYFSLAVCLASLWWLLLQCGCVIGFVVGATSVCSCVMFEIDLYTGMCVGVSALFIQCHAQDNYSEL